MLYHSCNSGIFVVVLMSLLSLLSLLWLKVVWGKYFSSDEIHLAFLVKCEKYSYVIPIVFIVFIKVMVFFNYGSVTISTTGEYRNKIDCIFLVWIIFKEIQK